MLKKILIISFYMLLSGRLFGKAVDVDVIVRSADIGQEMNESDLLSLNGFRQIITDELINLKLDSALFWQKLEQKKLSQKEEFQLLKSLFENVLVSQAAPLDVQSSEVKNEVKDEKINGHLKADLDLEKLKNYFSELTLNLSETKLKTFYIIGSIDIDTTMAWEDVGVSRSENFSGVIIDSWKKLAEKSFRGFERVVVLERELSNRPDYMNSRSVILKWNSKIKRISKNPETKTAHFEVSAQYVLLNSKTGEVLSSFDFPVQKREVSDDPKALSSTLASLVYNLLNSQVTKLSSLLENEAKVEVQSQLEVKIQSKTSLSEIFSINSFLQEKFKNLKLSSQMKSFSASEAILVIRANGNPDQILDALAIEGGKYPLNEQKLLLFNRADKSFAILPKDSNNKN